MIPHLIDRSLDAALNRIEECPEDGQALMNAMLPLRSDLAQFEKQLRQGVTHSSVALLLRVLVERDDIAQQVLPSSGQLDPVVERLLRGEALNSSSTVFGTWTALVLLRSKPIVDLLSRLPHRSEVLSAYLRVCKHEEVRRLRNALSHGTFDAEFQEMVYRDGSKVARISFPNLNRLNSALFSLWTAAWAVSLAPEGVTRI